MIIDLRSDTVTRPGKEMLESMFSASVGDMVFDEDPAVNDIEEYCAKLFGKERALFCPSGTMTNQIAIKLHTQPGDDVICSKLSHIYLYEGGGIGFNSGASVSLIDSSNGIFTVADVIESVQPDDPHRPRTSLVSLENSVNRGGGAVWPIDLISEISDFCREKRLAIHLDGARLFNAITATGDSLLKYGEMFDTISICLSKGLGAPVGSVLIGSSDHIKQGRRVRKVLGGTMRQAGYLAAAGLYALKNNVERLTIDHLNAERIAESLKKKDWVENVMKVETNIVIFNTVSGLSAQDVVLKLKESDILVLATGKRSVRFVTHLDISDKMIDKVLSTVDNLESNSFNELNNSKIGSY